MNHLSKYWVGGLAAGLILVLATAPAWADEITMGGLNYPNIRVVALRDGRLYYLMPGGAERSALLQDIQVIKLERYPELVEADQALAKGKFTEAARALEKLQVKAKEEWLQTLVTLKLVVSLDSAGEFPKALDQYLKLLRQETGAMALAVVPRRLPKELEQRQALAKLVAAEVKTAADAAVRQTLEALVERLEAPPDQAAPDEPMPEIALGGEIQERDTVGEEIAKGRAAALIEGLTKRLQLEDAPLPKVLYDLGRCQAAVGQDQDAAVSFMRVIVHFKPRICETYLPSLIEAGKSFVKLKQPQHARDLWEEALKLLGEPEQDREKIQVQEIQKLLSSLPARPKD